MNPSDTNMLVSVCLQTYQQAAFIRQAIDSVLAQETDFPFEILIGEDDSTDGTREICQEYAQRFPGRIRLFLRHEQEKIYINGVKTGRFNFLSNLQAARGKYIALLDGDDYWPDTRKLQKQVDALEKDPSLSICFSQVAIEQEGVLRPYKAVRGTKNIFSATDLALNCFIQTCAILFRNPGFTHVPAHFYETPVLDYALYLYLASKGKILYLKEAKAVYRFHAQGFWTLTQKEEQVRKLWLFLDRVIPEYKGPVQDALITQRHRLIRTLVKRHIRLGEKQKLAALLNEIEQRSPKDSPSTPYLLMNRFRYQLKGLFKQSH
ncbi:MAG: glycosyltransferase [Chitinophagaceae bacterium]|nr:glycosyltransferase [Chitinophagaceae bacterium]